MTNTTDVLRLVARVLLSAFAVAWHGSLLSCETPAKVFSFESTSLQLVSHSKISKLTRPESSIYTQFLVVKNIGQSEIKIPYYFDSRAKVGLVAAPTVWTVLVKVDGQRDYYPELPATYDKPSGFYKLSVGATERLQVKVFETIGQPSRGILCTTISSWDQQSSTLFSLRQTLHE
jgi:hypothetical protein